MKLTKNKRKYLENLSDVNGFISALAIDQRGALKKMINKHETLVKEIIYLPDLNKNLVEKILQK